MTEESQRRAAELEALDTDTARAGIQTAWDVEPSRALLQAQYKYGYGQGMAYGWLVHTLSGGAVGIVATWAAVVIWLVVGR